MMTREFSGGWRMRAELARILLMQPDLLLLDEPTNHLDLPAIQWLEDLLRTYPAALVLISHDKTFLDKLTKRTLEVTGGEIIDRKVPWSQYVELRKVEREQQSADDVNPDPGDRRQLEQATQPSAHWPLQNSGSCSEARGPTRTSRRRQCRGVIGSVATAPRPGIEQRGRRS